MFLLEAHTTHPGLPFCYLLKKFKEIKKHPREIFSSHIISHKTSNFLKFSLTLICIKNIYSFQLGLENNLLSLCASHLYPRGLLKFSVPCILH